MAGDDYQSPHIDLAKSRCSTPRNVIKTTANENKGIETYTITDVMDLVTSKFNEVLDAQEDNMRKIMKENTMLRKRMLEVLGDGDKPESLKKLKKAIKAIRADTEPLMFNGKDLMRFIPTDEGPSVFGRTIAAEVFGNEKECKLINQGLAPKVHRKNTRGACDSELEDIFIQCVNRNYINDTDEALSRAIAGANQFGTEMKQKHFPDAV